MPLISALGKQRQVDLCEFETNLVYKSYFQDSLQRQRDTLSGRKKYLKMILLCIVLMAVYVEGFFYLFLSF